jgi:hypothetical protein
MVLTGLAGGYIVSLSYEGLLRGVSDSVIFYNIKYLFDRACLLVKSILPGLLDSLKTLMRC